MSIDYTGISTPSKKLNKLFTYVPDNTSAAQAAIKPPAIPAPTPVYATTPFGSGVGYILLSTATFDQSIYNQLVIKYDGRVAYVGGSYWVGL